MKKPQQKDQHPLDNMFKELERPLKPSFPGPFFSWKCSFSIDGYRGFSYDFVVLSSGRRQAIHRFLWYKLVWDELSSEEFLLFITMSETLKNDKMVGFLRARLEIPKRILRKRLLCIEKLLGEPETSHTKYLGMKRIRHDLFLEKRKLRKTPKFSGYIRNNSRMKGNLGGGHTCPPVIPDESLILEVLSSKGFPWYETLTVGEFTMLGQKISLPDETKQSRNGQIIH